MAGENDKFEVYQDKRGSTAGVVRPLMVRSLVRLAKAT